MKSGNLIGLKSNMQNVMYNVERFLIQMKKDDNIRNELKITDEELEYTKEFINKFSLIYKRLNEVEIKD
jgi:hypothetical protein